MAELIYGGEVISLKSDLYSPAIPAGADPTKYYQAADWNAQRQYFLDVRSAVLAGRLHGFTGEATRPVVSGASRFLWVDSDNNKLYYYNGTTDTELGGGGGHTIKANGTPLTARTGLNFSSEFGVTDDAGNNETDVALAVTLSPHTFAHGTAGTFPVVINKTGAAQESNSLLDFQRGGATVGWWQLDASDNTSFILQTGKTLTVEGAGMTASIDDANNNAAVNPLTLRHTTSGTAASGIGTGLLFQAENGSGNTASIARITAVCTNVSNGVEDGNLHFYVAQNGALTEMAKIDTDGLATFNVALSTLGTFSATGLATFYTAPQVSVENATTNAVTTLLTLGHSTTGTAVSGIGSGILLKTEDGGGASQDAGHIAAVLSTVTGGSEKGYLRLQATDGAGALADSAYFWGTGRVGIGTGTTEPVGTLEVKTAAGVAAAFVPVTNRKDNSAAALNYLEQWYRQNTQVGYALADASDQFWIGGGAQAAIGFLGSAVQLYHSGARVNVTSSALLMLSGTRFMATAGADVASASTLTLGNGNYFKVTGTTTIDYITTTGWQAGSEVTLEFAAALTVTNGGGAPPGGTAALKLAGAANFSATADDTLTLVYNGTSWIEKCRSVN
jgi:hypothetical protein